MRSANELLISLGSNIGLVAVLALACSLLPNPPPGGRLHRIMPVFIGVLFGVVTLLGMRFPVVFSEGVLVDGKTILVPLAVFFYGPVAGMTTVAMAALYRLYQGGIGTFPGIFILFSGAAI